MASNTSDRNDLMKPYFGAHVRKALFKYNVPQIIQIAALVSLSV